MTLRRDEDGEWHAERSAGGLATAMNPILRRTGGLWIGWSGEAPQSRDPAREALIRGWERSDNLFDVGMPAQLGASFYQGYPNQTVWPLFHYFPSLLQFDPAHWNAYVQGNRRFRDAVVERARPGDLIWVHDYHLMLLPRMLREAIPDARIGFFLHIPFPSSEIFALLPRREEVLEGLLGADLVAFHTHNYLQHFRSSLLRLLALESSISEVHTDGRAVRLAALPIGIAPEDFRMGDDAMRVYEDLRGAYRDQRVLLAVDRLDYTKGIPERLRAFRRLLKNSEGLRGRLTLIQVAVPSREGIESYKDLGAEVNQLVGEINGKLGNASWTPVVYINRGIGRPELLALYRLADVGWVTPLRDGMNLVAKEYAASKPEGDGVLVLSEFAGAAAEMGEALMVNPLDEERTADTLERALNMDPEERGYRMRALHKRVLRNNVFTWGERFLAELKQASQAQPAVGPARLDAAVLCRAWRSASRRLVILDYDGTLAPFAALPQRAAPGPGLLSTLSKLAADPANCVALVSGRRAADLDGWFGAIPNLILAAEHGALLRAGGEWTPCRPGASTEWKNKVRPILEHFVDRNPGSFVEEKEFALVWHYRSTEREFGEWLANELAAMLESMLAETELRATRGHKIVEVKPLWANKGQLLDRLRDA
ncbi:MAG: bifunctional alpha,alpha-trehalose-phosphate synthase (UDP-forming)/trehalose-phosphatase [Acidobacteria bacterium]|nr:bifunctional alpha,alpha-trehalose-phosphate synthase (UDP-forming)/trehalose-phosphatase [Acidobacteriota bacterium]